MINNVYRLIRAGHNTRHNQASEGTTTKEIQTRAGGEKMMMRFIFNFFSKGTALSVSFKDSHVHLSCLCKCTMSLHSSSLSLDINNCQFYCPLRTKFTKCGLHPKNVVTCPPLQGALARRDTSTLEHKPYIRYQPRGATIMPSFMWIGEV